MAPRDRTREFHSTLHSIRQRSNLSVPSAYSLSADSNAQVSQRLLPNGAGNDGSHSGGKKGRSALAGTSEFARMAGQIGKDINATTIKLQKLAQLAKRKTLFDDRPVEISELTYIIRQDISALNAQIAQLQQYVRSQQAAVASGKGKAKAEGQVEEHNTNVVMMLQSRLASMGMGFKDVLELRTQNMKASKDRSEQFMHTTSSSAQSGQGGGLLGSSNQAASASSASIPALPPTSSLLLQPHDRKGKRAATAPGTRAGTPDSMAAGSSAKRTLGGADYLALDMNGDGGENGLGMGSVQAGSANQQAQMMEQQDNYIQSRSTAIESIESTISELGQIFQQLAHMVAEQRDTVQRIDADTTDIAANVSGAQRELLKYYASVTSNRWLMLKIFGVLIIFFLVFILVS
ncbi:hypothetical protein NliqN6_0807 [Naganishia liquefaciens]|uniref:t-SNARE coiled-coil homology domain-containing protein n=1 Tax=Naganishia liquefaciens TaxID=104408 RepID=A0A8H3TPX1_9TREE|nr:hypothetical protein NliqN6_0807 [Naganishia liquefaciens]